MTVGKKSVRDDIDEDENNYVLIGKLKNNIE